MNHYGFPPKFVTIIHRLYEDATCQVIRDGKLTEPFSIQTEVCQGCLLSPTIFLLVVDWIMQQAMAGRTGIQWTLTKQLEDLDYADDITLVSHRQQGAQEKLFRIAEEAEKTVLQINIGKAKVMRVNNKKQDPVHLHQENIKEVNKFVYPGSVVSKDGGAHEDMKCRINQSTTGLQHPTANLEINSSLISQQDPDLRYQRQVGPTLRLRNLAGNKDQHPQTPDIYQQMSQEHPQHQVAGSHLK